MEFFAAKSPRSTVHAAGCDWKFGLRHIELSASFRQSKRFVENHLERPLFSGFAESLTHGLPHPCVFGRLRRHLCCAQEHFALDGGKIHPQPSALPRLCASRREFAPSKKITPAYARAFPHSMIWSPERPRKSSEPQFRKEIKPHLLDDFSRRALTSAML